MNRYTQKLIKRVTTRLIILVTGTVTPVLSMASKLVNRKIKRLFIESKVEAVYWTISERSEAISWFGTRLPRSLQSLAMTELDHYRTK